MKNIIIAVLFIAVVSLGAYTYKLRQDVPAADDRPQEEEVETVAEPSPVDIDTEESESKPVDSPIIGE